MSVKSKLILLEKVDNEQSKKFGASTEYFPAYTHTASGDMQPMLFTESQIRVAKERAQKLLTENPEHVSFWKLLFSEYIHFKRQNGEY